MAKQQIQKYTPQARCILKAGETFSLNEECLMSFADGNDAETTLALTTKLLAMPESVFDSPHKRAFFMLDHHRKPTDPASKFEFKLRDQSAFYLVDHNGELRGNIHLVGCFDTQAMLILKGPISNHRKLEQTMARGIGGEKAEITNGMEDVQSNFAIGF